MIHLIFQDNNLFTISKITLSCENQYTAKHKKIEKYKNNKKTKNQIIKNNTNKRWRRVVYE